MSRIVVLHQASTPQLRALKEISHKVELVSMKSWFSGRGVKGLLACADTAFLILVLPGEFIVEIVHEGLVRFCDVATQANAGMVYSDLREERDNQLTEYSLIDYQLGSVSETFDFGALVLISKQAVTQVLTKYGPVDPELSWAGFYDLRLKIATDFPIVRIPESIYRRKLFAQTSAPSSSDTNVERYLGPRNKEYQAEMERTLAAHLRRIGAYLEPVFAALPAPEDTFPVTASIIVPVRNREKTIGDALNSALQQRAPFDYNVIVVDDHSTDRTTDIVKQFAERSSKVIHQTPTRRDLGIGGLWNHAIYSPECGLFAVQLDSDDVYSDAHVLEKLISEFYRPTDSESPKRNSDVPSFAMVIGSYTTVNFKLEEIPPGLVDHREWTRENGRNNALRLTGLGAPRAFYVPVLRQIGFPNFSAGYAEDYLVCLRISREYEIGRCYDSLYLARRWDENSDRTPPLAVVKGIEFKTIVSALSGARPDLLEQIWPMVLTLVSVARNRFESYNDWLRTVEIMARQDLLSGPVQQERVLSSQPIPDGEDLSSHFEDCRSVHQ